MRGYIYPNFEVAQELIQSFGTYIVNIGNSSFGVAAVGSFFGAVGGYAMVMLTDRRKELMSKVSAINAAIVTSHMLFEVCVGLKKQHLMAMGKRYRKEKSSFLESIKAQTKAPRVITIPFDFQKLTLPPINFELINSKLLDKTDLPGRAPALAMTLINSLSELRNLLEERHLVIEEINAIVTHANLSKSEKNRMMACLLRHPQNHGACPVDVVIPLSSFYSLGYGVEETRTLRL